MAVDPLPPVPVEPEAPPPTIYSVRANADTSAHTGRIEFLKANDAGLPPPIASLAALVLRAGTGEGSFTFAVRGTPPQASTFNIDFSWYRPLPIPVPPPEEPPAPAAAQNSPARRLPPPPKRPTPVVRAGMPRTTAIQLDVKVEYMTADVPTDTRIRRTTEGTVGSVVAVAQGVVELPEAADVLRSRPVVWNEGAAPLPLYGEPTVADVQMMRITLSSICETFGVQRRPPLCVPCGDHGCLPAVPAHPVPVKDVARMSSYFFSDPPERKSDRVMSRQNLSVPSFLVQQALVHNPARGLCCNGPFAVYRPNEPHDHAAVQIADGVDGDRRLADIVEHMVPILRSFTPGDDKVCRLLPVGRTDLHVWIAKNPAEMSIPPPDNDVDTRHCLYACVLAAFVHNGLGSSRVRVQGYVVLFNTADHGLAQGRRAPSPGEVPASACRWSCSAPPKCS